MRRGDRLKAATFVPVTEISADATIDIRSLSADDGPSNYCSAGSLSESSDPAWSPTVLDKFAPRMLSNKDVSIYKFLPVLIKLYNEVSTSLAFARLYVIFYFSGSPVL